MSSIQSAFGKLTVDERKIVVGIDFGTTFSGLAWAERKRKDQISVIESWPKDGSPEGASDAKVPTQLRYNGNKIEWGYEIPSEAERHEWFKLRLMGGPPRKAEPTGSAQRPEELTADYLTALIKHLRYILGQKLGAAVLRSVPLEFVLTVPAGWTERAKGKTLAACQKAGLDTKTAVTLVSEPEAAAVYTLQSLDPHGLEIGDTFVLCDAGGGTVDLISYTITGLYPKLQIKEAAPGTCGFCGSTYLDERFSKYLVAKLGRDPEWDSEVLREAMSQFDTIKRGYSSAAANGDGYSISVPGLSNNPALGVRRGKWKMTALEMKAIFDPVIDQVIALVQGQMTATKRTIKAVLLVGGFGQNLYLKERLRASMSSSIEVRQPANAWTAVVRGAVMVGSQTDAVQLMSRQARKHYGIKMICAYDAGKRHVYSERFWHAPEQEYFVWYMSWFVRKGEALKVGSPVAIPFILYFKVSEGYPKSATLEIWHDENSATAPIHPTSNVKSFAKLEGDLAQVPKSEMNNLVKKLPDGNQYYAVAGAVEATFNSASMKYVLLIGGMYSVHNRDKELTNSGIRYDVVTVDYS